MINIIKLIGLINFLVDLLHILTAKLQVFVRLFCCFIFENFEIGEEWKRKPLIYVPIFPKVPLKMDGIIHELNTVHILYVILYSASYICKF